jgi:WD40 repeat protein
MDAPATPFKGLAPFEASDVDALLFFGRDRERELIVANLLASRLTVLYGPVGVGKSSLLRAGVAHRLRQEVGPDGRPDYAVVVFDAWSEDPWASLRTAIDAELAGRDTAETDVLLLVDQTEEYFLYHEREDGPGTFAGELPGLVTDPSLRMSVLLAIREDALARLDRFKGSIPNLFSNYLRLDHLNRDDARAAILGPVDRYNRLAGEHFEVEDALVEAVLDETAVGQVDFGSGGAGRVAAEQGEQRVEAPYLQLVLRRLWDAERAEQSDTLKLATFERLGGAEAIVRAHLERALADLDQRERDLAASVFRHLVTPSGAKIAHAVDDLAEYADVDAGELRPVVTKLVEERILRPVAAAGDGSDGVPHEIYHDVLGDAVLAWRTRHETERRLGEQRALAQRKHRRALTMVGVSLVALAVMTGIAIYALAQRSEARTQAHEARMRAVEAKAQALIAGALGDLDVNPQTSLRLAYRAARLRSDDASENTLRRALLASRLRGALHVGGPVVEASYSPEGRRILAAGKGGQAQIYEARTRRLLHAFGKSVRLRNASWSPDGSLVLTTGRNYRAMLWDAASGRRVMTFRHGTAIRAASFGGDEGSLVLTAGGKRVKIWNTRDGSIVGDIGIGREVRDAALSADGRHVVVVAGDRFARVYAVATGAAIYSLDQGGVVTSASFTPSGRVIATSGEDRTATLWSMETGRKLFSLPGHAGRVLRAVVDPRGKLVATVSTDGTARLWEIGHGRLFSQLSGHLNSVTGAAFTRDGFSSIVTTSTDGTARVWKPSGGPPRAVLAGHNGAVTTAAFSPDRSRVITGDEGGTVRIWDPRAEPQLSLLRRYGHRVSQIARSPDGRFLVVGTDAGASIVDAAGRVVLRLPVRDAVVAIAYSRDGRDVAAVTRGRALIFDAHSGGRLAMLAPGSDISAVDFGPGGIVATAGVDGAVRLWRRDGRPSRRVAVGSRPLTSVRFDRAGRRFVTGSVDRTAKVFTVGGELKLTLKPHRNTVTSAVFSPDGRFVLTASLDKEARTWDARTGKLVRRLGRQGGGIRDAEYSPDGRWIVTAGPVTAALWDGTGEHFIFFMSGHRPVVRTALFEPDSRRIITAGTDGTVRRYTCEVCGHLPSLLALARARIDAAGPS